MNHESPPPGAHRIAAVACKGPGGCKTANHDRHGKNERKGLGGCESGGCETAASDAQPVP